MRSLILSGLLALALALPARADEAAIRKVITAQIEAFQADDFDTAFTFASQVIQGIFGTPENFGTMVRQGYPMVWRPAETTFLDLEMVNGSLWQSLMIRDQNEQIYILDYQMVLGENGWKINAVQIRKAPGGTA